MKLERWLSAILAAIFAFLLSFAPVACLITAFRLPVSLETVALACAGLALLTGLTMALKCTWAMPGLLAISAFLLWFWGGLSSSVETLLYTLSRFYDGAYATGTLFWSAAPPDADCTLACLLLSAIVCLTVAITVFHRKALPAALAFTLLPLCACLVVTDTVPDTWCLALLVGGIIWLLLTQLSRREEERKGNRLSLLTVLPVALAVALLFQAIPQDAYEGKLWADKLLQDTQTIINQNLPQAVSREDLTTTGNFNNPHLPLLSLSAQQSGRIYLRQQIFGTYTGTAWEAGNSYSPHSQALPNYETDTHFWESAGQVTLNSPGDFLYVPLYAQAAENAQGIVPREAGGDYTFTRYVPFGNDRLYLQTYAPNQSHIALLPEQTQAWATELSKTLTADCKYTTQAVQAIAEYVKNSAVYATRTQRLPSGRTDFAQWFLEEGESGYCTHFATAATVLLQAAGIPARYVTGYCVTAGENTTVYHSDAHAWAEYFIPSLGWLILEATPESADAPPVTQPETTESTLPSQTESDPTEGEDPVTPQQTLPAAPKPQPENDSPAPLWPFLLPLAFIALVLGQWQLRLAQKRRRQSRGHPNRRAIALWKEACLYSKLLKEKPPAQLLELAQKARFSQHTLDRSELAAFDSHLRHYRQKMQQLPLYRKLLLWLIYAPC